MLLVDFLIWLNYEEKTIQTDLFLIALLVLGVVLAYYPVLGNDFIYQWDD